MATSPAGSLGTVVNVLVTNLGVTSPNGTNYNGTPNTLPIHLCLVCQQHQSNGRADPGGIVITINGVGFTPTSTVTFGPTVPATNVQFVSSTQLKATNPAENPGVVNVLVSNGDIRRPMVLIITVLRIPTSSPIRRLSRRLSLASTQRRVHPAQ